MIVDGPVIRTANGMAVLSIDDERWKNVPIVPYSANRSEEEDVQEATGVDAAQCTDLSCTVCELKFEGDQEDFRAHYRSDWHRYNLRRSNKGRSPQTEEEFERKISDDESSTTESESDASVLESTDLSREYFICEGSVYSLYRSILRNSETVSSEVLSRPLDCALFLLSGGHFSGGIYRNNFLVAHKCFHRYVVRAKQGGSQSAADSKHKIHSGGATLRRYNERALGSEIRVIIESWGDELQDVPVVFIRCSTQRRSIFFPGGRNSLFLKSDERVRSVPFATRRPTLAELRRIWMKLKSIQHHGTVEEFEIERKRRAAVCKKRKCVLRRKAAISEADLSDESLAEHASEDCELTSVTRIESKNESPKRVYERSKPSELYEKGNEIYSSVRLNSLVRLRSIIESSGSAAKFVRVARYPRNSSTLLHIAARCGAIEMIHELLLIGCDPSNKDADMKVPYQVAQNRAVRQAFSNFRAMHSDMYDWNKSQIPEPVELDEEKLAKDAERKRLQREKRKAREKLKKEERQRQAVANAEREAFLALPDSEKRALAAERRLAASLQTRCLVVESDGNRCFKCGIVLTSVPFEYSSNRFCSLACLQHHRRENNGLGALPPG